MNTRAKKLPLNTKAETRAKMMRTRMSAAEFNRANRLAAAVDWSTAKLVRFLLRRHVWSDDALAAAKLLRGKNDG